MRVAVYARVSTEHEAQINALGNQLEWYKIEGSRHSDWEIVEVYVDQGITGTQAQKRPEFLHMIEDAKKGKFDLILRKQACGFPAFEERTARYFQSVQQKCKQPQIHHRLCGIKLCIWRQGVTSLPPA